jgi:LPXTG-motif cell wall-anchored protein
MSVPFDESLLTDTPKSYKYDPSPPSPSKDDLGNTIYSPNLITQTYTLRKYKKPHELIPLKTRDNTFFVNITKPNGGDAVGYSDKSVDKNNVITDQLLPNFNKCTADPKCWGIVIQNTSNTPAKFFGSYTFDYYKKPTTSGPSSPNTDPIELLDCDFTNTYYTFIKNVDGVINPDGPITCVPPSTPPPSTDTTNNINKTNCPPSILDLSANDKNYYYCKAILTTPPIPSIWSQPTTWIIIVVVVLLLAGGGYYFWKKRQDESSSIDYSKYFKKKKGGYYFFI